MTRLAPALVFRALIRSSVQTEHKEGELSLTVKTFFHLSESLRLSTKNATVSAIHSTIITALAIMFSIRLRLVTMTGVEPAHREIHASETCVSTNSTTWPNDTLFYPATGIAVVPHSQQSVRRRG